MHAIHIDLSRKLERWYPRSMLLLLLLLPSPFRFFFVPLIMIDWPDLLRAPPADLARAARLQAPRVAAAAVAVIKAVAAA